MAVQPVGHTQSHPVAFQEVSNNTGGRLLGRILMTVVISS